jgi:hypothetical protein
MTPNRINKIENSLSLVRPDGPELVFSILHPCGAEEEGVHRIPTAEIHPSLIIPDGRALFFRFPARKGIFRMLEVRLTGIGRDILVTVVEVDRDQVLSALALPGSS